MFAVSCAALVLALACVWLPVFCLRIGKTVGSTQFFLFVSGMSADIMHECHLLVSIDHTYGCYSLVLVRQVELVFRLRGSSERLGHEC